jgi:hypothetical protein
MYDEGRPREYNSIDNDIEYKRQKSRFEPNTPLFHFKK